jgi:hypothetical protein
LRVVQSRAKVPPGTWRSSVKLLPLWEWLTTRYVVDVAETTSTWPGPLP